MNDATTSTPGTHGHVPVDGHEHVHDQWCGHPAVSHQDHVDYLHDGHVHTPCSDHVEALPDCDDVGRAVHLPHSAHMHVHTEDCGHQAVAHEGHLDYMHGRHRHAVHETHYDEH